METDLRRRVDALVERQHGLLGRRQGIALGMTPAEYGSLTSGWPIEHRGVRRSPHVPRTVKQRMLGAVMAAGDGALATRSSAARLHGLVDRDPAAIEILIPHGRRVDIPGVNVTRSRLIARRDQTEVDCIPCTSTARTVYEMAAVTTQDDLRGILLDGRQRRLLDFDDLLLCMAQRTVVRGRRKLLEVVAQLDPGSADSMLTHLVTERLIEDGYPIDVPAVTIDVGDRTLHPDVTASAAKVLVEADGRVHLRTRIQDLDHRKHNAYLRAGWLPLRIGWDRLHRDWRGFAAEFADAVRLGASRRR